MENTKQMYIPTEIHNDTVERGKQAERKYATTPEGFYKELQREKLTREQC